MGHLSGVSKARMNDRTNQHGVEGGCGDDGLNKRQDQRPDIRKTNTKSKVLASSRISEHGLLQGLYHAFMYILTLLKLISSWTASF